MFEEHSVFEKPSDPNAVIWRYMDFTKFVDLMDTKSLFFTRADRFEDRFEGSYPEFNVKFRPGLYNVGGVDHDEVARRISKTSQAFRRFVTVNCWHMNPYESAAMWRLYLKSNEGIAIQSTYSRLVSSFLPCAETIYVGVVKYIDYETEWIPEGNLYYPYVHKRKSFAHENELRAVIVRVPRTKHGLDPSLESISGGGINVAVDLNLLVSAVYVAPSCPIWLTKLIESITRKYGVNADVIQSALDKNPVY